MDYEVNLKIVRRRTLQAENGYPRQTLVVPEERSPLISNADKGENPSNFFFFHDPLLDFSSAASKSSSVWVMFWILLPA